MLRSHSRTGLLSASALFVLSAVSLMACDRSPVAPEEHGAGTHPDTTGTDPGGKSSATDLAGTALTSSPAGGGGTAGSSGR